MTKVAHALLAYMVITLTGLVGWASMIGFVVFLFTGSWDLVDLHLNETAALWLDAGLCLLFFVQHSTMIRGAFRRGAARYIPEAYFGALYTVVSGIILILMMVLWQGSPRVLASADGSLRWFLRCIFFLAVAGVPWGLSALGSFDAFGLKAIRHRPGDPEPPPVRFTVRGPYRWVRHPLYSLYLLMIWSCPDLTADRLVFNTLFTVWMVVGTFLEERDLIVTFGDDYREYRKKVPMLLPVRLRPAY